MSRPLVVLLLALICTLLWGSAFPALKVSYVELGITQDTYGQMLFAGARFFFAGIMILLLLVLSGQKVSFPSIQLKEVIALAIFSTSLQYFFFYIGIAHTTGVKGSILMSTSSFFAVGLSALLYREDNLSSQKIAGLFLGLLGVVALNLSKGSLELNFSLQGDLFLIFSCLANAIASVLIKGFSTHLNIVLVTGWQMIIGSLFLIALGAFKVSLEQISFSWFTLNILCYLSFLSAAAFSLWNILLKYNNVSRITIFNFLVPVFGSLLSAFIVPGEKIGISSLLGLALVSSGILVMNYQGKTSSYLKEDI